MTSARCTLPRLMFTPSCLFSLPSHCLLLPQVICSVITKLWSRCAHEKNLPSIEGLEIRSPKNPSAATERTRLWHDSTTLEAASGLPLRLQISPPMKCPLTELPCYQLSANAVSLKVHNQVRQSSATETAGVTYTPVRLLVPGTIISPFHPLKQRKIVQYLESTRSQALQTTEAPLVLLQTSRPTSNPFNVRLAIHNHERFSSCSTDPQPPAEPLAIPDAVHLSGVDSHAAKPDGLCPNDAFRMMHCSVFQRWLP